MRAVLTAAVAAIEACAVALAGLVLVGVPAVLLWWLVFGLAAEPAGVLAATAGIWLLAHFVPLGVDLGAEAALGLGLPPEQIAFTISLAPLGITLLTALLAFRAGRRFAARGGGGSAGVAGGSLGFAAAAFAVVALGRPAEVWPGWAAVLVPAVCFGVCSAAGYLWGSGRDGAEWWGAAVRLLQRGVKPLGPAFAAALPARALEVSRLAGAAIAGLVGLGALGFAIALVAGYVEVITLSQALQLDPLGAVLLFLLDLALLPVAWIWAAAWFSGAGFAIGSGTSVSPFETLLGPVPALPILGAVPQGWGWAAALAPLLVVILGVAVGGLVGAGASVRRGGWGRAILVPLVAALVAGLAMAALAAFASGGIGPGRLSELGPHPWLAGGLVAAELGAGMILGVAARRIDTARLRDRLPALAGDRGDWEGGDLEGGDAVPGGAVRGDAVAAGDDAREAPARSAPRAPEPPVAAGSAEVGGTAAAEEETVPLDPLPKRTGTGRASAAPAAPPASAPIPEEIAPGADAEAILRAYAWEDGALPGGDEPPEARRKRPRWRLPRRSD